MNPGPKVELAELAAGLDQVARRARQIAQAARDSTALIPPHAEGSDPGAAVTVSLDAAGWPARVRVATDWARRIPASGFAGAVTTACQTAHRARLTGWDQQLALAARHAPSTPFPLLPAATGRPSTPRLHPAPETGPAAHRTGQDLVSTPDDLHSRLREIRPTVIDTPPPSPLTGRAANGRLTVEITADGVTTCTADPDWVADQSAAVLTMAVTEAIHHARTQPHTTATSKPTEPAVAELHRIAEQAIAAVHALAADSAAARRPAEQDDGRGRSQGRR